MRFNLFLISIFMLCSCATTAPPPQWNPISDSTEGEYKRNLAGGSASLSGQAFLQQVNGGTVKAAGKEVTLDPVTSVSDEWWNKAGALWQYRAVMPPSPGFALARRKTVADADGRFKFSGLTAGDYYVRTEIIWGGHMGSIPYTTGGVVGQIVHVNGDSTNEVVLSQLTFSKLRAMSGEYTNTD